MNGLYGIILKSQLGPKTGTLRIRRSRDLLLGVLEILGHKNVLAGKASEEGQAFELYGKIRTPLGSKACLLSCNRVKLELIGELRIENKSYEISGKKIENDSYIK